MTEAQPPIEDPVFLMTPPRRDWSLQGRANFRSRAAGSVDASRARREWAALADAIVDAGGEVLVCPPNPRRPLTGMIYTAEAGEFYQDSQDGWRFILPNMAAEHRRPEADWIGGFMTGIGMGCEAIEPIWEAQGDAIRGASPRDVIHTYGHGPDARTDADAFDAVAGKLGDRELHLPFDADPWFHGNTFLNVYRTPDGHGGWRGLAVVCPEALSDDTYRRLLAFLGDKTQIHTISREASLGYDTNSLQVGSTVIAPSTLSARTRTALSDFGLDIVDLDLGELFSKGGGAPVCLTNRLWGLTADALPAKHLWSNCHTTFQR
jgi:N-dimethylarginine dimethylaminohydrolase